MAEDKKKCRKNEKINNKEIYLDNNATTKISDEILLVALPYLKNEYGNASITRYRKGQSAACAINSARNTIERCLNCHNVGNIYFTSSGSESNNWAIKGVMLNHYRRTGVKGHIITSEIEHSSVLNSCKYLESLGFEVSYIGVDRGGFVNPKDIENAIKDNTVIISIMMANNEIGTIQPISEISRIAHKHNVIFHTDAVQALGHMDIDIEKKCYNVDLMSFSAHKIHGMKGVGALYINNEIKYKIDSLIHGGQQEFGLRASTENVAGIVSFGMAVSEICKDLFNNMCDIREKRNKLVRLVSKNIVNYKINGYYDVTEYLYDKRLCNNVNISFDGVSGENLMYILDMKNIFVSTGSACDSKSIKPSHVLKAIGLSDTEADEAIRISISKYTTDEDIKIFVERLTECVSLLRGYKKI